MSSSSKKLPISHSYGTFILVWYIQTIKNFTVEMIFMIVLKIARKNINHPYDKENTIQSKPYTADE